MTDTYPGTFQSRLATARDRGHVFADKVIDYKVRGPYGSTPPGYRANCLRCGRAVFTEGPWGYGAECHPCEPSPAGQAARTEITHRARTPINTVL